MARATVTAGTAAGMGGGDSGAAPTRPLTLEQVWQLALVHRTMPLQPSAQQAWLFVVSADDALTTKRLKTSPRMTNHLRCTLRF